MLLLCEACEAMASSTVARSLSSSARAASVLSMSATCWLRAPVAECARCCCCCCSSAPPRRRGDEQTNSRSDQRPAPAQPAAREHTSHAHNSSCRWGKQQQRRERERRGRVSGSGPRGPCRRWRFSAQRRRQEEEKRREGGREELDDGHTQCSSPRSSSSNGRTPHCRHCSNDASSSPPSTLGPPLAAAAAVDATSGEAHFPPFFSSLWSSLLHRSPCLLLPRRSRSPPFLPPLLSPRSMAASASPSLLRPLRGDSSATAGRSAQQHGQTEKRGTRDDACSKSVRLNEGGSGKTQVAQSI